MQIACDAYVHRALACVTLGFAIVFLCGYVIGHSMAPAPKRDAKGRFRRGK